MEQISGRAEVGYPAYCLQASRSKVRGSVHVQNSEGPERGGHPLPKRSN